ncbi:MAG: hypothetical protein QXI12_07495 [Candidatus Methanomethyliaceae archaeon]
MRKWRGRLPCCSRDTLSGTLPFSALWWRQILGGDGPCIEEGLGLLTIWCSEPNYASDLLGRTVREGSAPRSSDS